MSTELPQGQNAAAVLEFFKPPKPPPRVPAWDGQQHTLVFPSERSRAERQSACEVKVLEGCTAGLRAACSLQAVRQCSPHPLLRLLGLTGIGARNSSSWEEREACQQQHMAACIDPQLPACQLHARDFCTDAFAPGPTADALLLKQKQAQNRGR